MNEEAILWLKGVLSNYVNHNNRDENPYNDLCKHECKEKLNSYIICSDCGLYLERQISHGYNHYKNCKPRRNAYHSTKSYFVKNMEKHTNDLIFDKKRLLSDFDKQENVLKHILITEFKRKNSISVNYKLYKLLQHQGISHNNIKLLKCIEKHDQILKMVWSKSKLDWVKS